ncbi:MAG: DUF4386 domain-containing protein [Actinomycetales bacterium]|nr:DUF4386 domain-containing protein [Actinomycetales bacterium]
MSARPDTTRRAAARIAGAGYLALFVLAILANFVVKQGIFDAADPTATAAALVEQEGLFRLGVASWVAIALLDVLVAWALFVLVAPAGRSRALLVAWFRVVYAALLGAGVVFQLLALEVATGAESSPELAMLLLGGFDLAWSLGLVAFGLHLVLLGALLLRARIAPRWIAVVLMAAGAAYLVDNLARVLMTDYAAIAPVMMAVVAIPSIVAELSFTVWLLLAGRRSSAATREAEPALAAA